MVDMGRMKLLERHERLDALLTSVKLASDADQRLAAMLADPASDWYGQIKIVAALGEVRPGPAGSEALRRVFATATASLTGASKSIKPWYCDLICASVAGLARRDGPAATDVSLAAARSANAIIRDFGMTALAVSGDDRAWDEMLTRLRELLQRTISVRGMRWRETCRAIEYLARHAQQGSDRPDRLVGLLRERWRHLPHPGLIDQWWPGISPGGPPPRSIDLAKGHTPDLWWRETPDDVTGLWPDGTGSKITKGPVEC